MPPISKPKVRFDAASGEQFLENGKIRCHALAKSKLRKWREAYDDHDTPTDDLWPECQCELPAEEGYYVCRFHGGKTPRTVSAPRSMLDVMPLDMANKYRAIMDSPEYISRKDDINLIRTRIVMLLEELNNEAGSEEAWSHVHEALNKIKRGDNINAIEYLERAISAEQNKHKVWQEIYKTEKLLGDLTNTQMRTAKELQSMATAEQVSGLISTLIHTVLAASQSYIIDPMQRTQFTNMIVGEVQKLTGTTPKEVVEHARYTDS